MGYYTYYRLSTDKPELIDEIEKYAKEHVPELLYAVDSLDGSCCNECKWYEHEGDMSRLSMAFPDVTFFLSGEGEENLDIWEKDFKGGAIIRSSSVESDLHRYNQLIELCKKLLIPDELNGALNTIEVKLATWGY